MIEVQNVYCPICKDKVGRYDGKRTINLVCTCVNCNKSVIFDVNSGETSYKKREIRSTSSGARFN